ncbi:MAG: ABC transporter permease [Planctomycetaceae bacterium]|nr:ABC transporter permease [Planctomycetaceae bacterium]
MLAVVSLAWRELIRFLRQRTRIVGALGQPLLFWVLFGAGLQGSFQDPRIPEAAGELSYQAYFFPGVTVLILLFTAIFSTISIIEDRREGFLQGVLVAPVPRSALVLGKVGGGTVLAVLQAGLFLLIGPLLSLVGLAPDVSLPTAPLQLLGLAGFLILLAAGLTGLGYVIAWPMNSTQGFHAIMSVFLLPMWLLSGAIFPGTESPWLSWLIRLNPLTYGVAGVRRLLSATPGASLPAIPDLSTCIVVTVLFTGLCLVVAVLLTRRQTSPDHR